MRGDFLKPKALFMAIIIITAIFTVTNFNLVSAEDTTNYCCEATKDGEYCQYTTYDQCNTETPFLTSATTCEQTTYCEGGCCVSNEGKCSKNVPKSVCENTEDYTWYDDMDCNIAQCEKQCCTVADSVCSYTTSAHCEVINSQYPEIESEFVTVDDEYACVDICTASNKGCCISPDGCTYDTKGLCETPDINLNEETGFYDGRFCSDLNLCGCNEHDETKCIDEDVYWFDSCGNQEGVVQPGDKYWEGDIYEVEGQKDGDCDYTKGTWCGYTELSEAYCKSVDCKDLRKNENEEDDKFGAYTFNGIYNIEGANIFNDHDARLGLERNHGESWCLYESPTGDYLDRPGSQHYRTYCYFGEEIIESCRDYREEVCIQYPYYGDETEETGSACVDNNIYDAPLNTNITTVPKGNEFWSETVETSSCSEGTQTCEVTFIKESNAEPSWKCLENCECLTDYWMINASKTCSSKGDCGANYNIVEKYIEDGFYITKSELAKKQGGGDKWSALAYDIACETNDHYKNAEYENNPGLLCNDNCKGFDNEGIAISTAEYDGTESQMCRFWNYISDSPWYLEGTSGTSTEKISNPTIRENSKYLYTTITRPNGHGLKNAYGVHGGMVGVSQLIEEMLATDAGAELLSEISKNKWVSTAAVGIPVATILIITYAIGAAAITAATATGASFAATGVFASFTAGLGAVGAGLGGAATGTLLAETGAATVTGAVGGVAGATSVVPIIGWIIAIALVVATALIFILQSGGESTTVTVTANCETWQAPSGGDDCHLCDLPVSEGGLALDDGSGKILPGYDCSEYKCRSLGAACNYISENSGTSREKCYNDAINDVNHPVIKLDKDIWELHYPGQYEPEGSNFAQINDIAPYTVFHFGITTEELSQCKISETLPDTYDEMTELFPDSYYDKSHNQTRVLTPNEEFTYYVRCQDHAGNYNIDPYVFKITTLDVDDEQAPLIIATEPPTNTYVPETVLNGEEAFIIYAYTSESVDQCKWSYSDQEYDLMENIFLTGTTTPDAPTTELEWHRSTTLNISNLGDNLFYFACMDGSGNINSQNYEYNLIGTEGLNIDRTSPNGTLYYNTVTLQVETSAGAESGKSVCYYDTIEFFTTNSSYHEQVFEGLGEGDYTHNILCQDKAGNRNSTTITYTIDIDEIAPELTSLYTLSNTLYFELSEDATCEYHYEEFDFGEGTSTTGTIALTDISTYYIICEDEFSNDAEFTVEV